MPAEDLKNPGALLHPSSAMPPEKKVSFWYWMLLILIVSFENMYTNLPQCAELYICEKLRKSIQNIDKSIQKLHKSIQKKDKFVKLQLNQ